MSAAPAVSAPRRRVRWSLVALTFAVLAAIVALRKAEPTYADKLAPLTVPGATGQRLVARNFAVEAKGFKLAHAYLTPGDFLHPEPRRMVSAGVWMSVVADLEASQVPGYASAQLRTRDGLIYPASSQDRPKFDAVNLTGRPLAPGLLERGAWFFELPPDRVEGAHLQVYWGGLTPGAMDSLVDVDLGIDAARAAKALAQAPAVLDLRP